MAITWWRRVIVRLGTRVRLYLDYLENVPIDLDRNYEDFRYPVQ